MQDFYFDCIEDAAHMDKSYHSPSSISASAIKISISVHH